MKKLGKKKLKFMVSINIDGANIEEVSYYLIPTGSFENNNPELQKFLEMILFNPTGRIKENRLETS